MKNSVAKVIFPKKENVSSEMALYFRCDEKIEFFGNTMLFSEKSTCSLLTYFNSISYSKLLKYTDIKKLRFSFSLSGTATITIKSATLDTLQSHTESENTPLSIPPEYASVEYIKDNFHYLGPLNLKEKNSIHEKVRKADFHSKTLAQKSFNSIDSCSFSIDFDISSCLGEGIIYVEIEGEKEAIISNCEYIANHEVKRHSKIGIVFCTFRREEFVKANVKKIVQNTLANDYTKDKYGIFVIDNGQTLKTEDVKEATLIPNKNTGGSGGFTKGIEVVTACKEYTHFLLMDDDIRFETEIFARILFWTENVINVDRTTIGGSMLLLEKPYFQYEAGARYDNSIIIPNKYAYDFRSTHNVVRNEHEVPTNYQAWWCCCMPTSTPSRIGLPLQFFIKGDDIEYSLRAENQIIITNGIGVWHESFISKYSSELEYYIKRNELIVNAVSSKTPNITKQIKKLFRGVAKQLVFHRYATLKHIFLAYDHFLKGPKFFSSIDPEQMHKELRKEAIKQYSKEELKEMGYDIDEKDIVLAGDTSEPKTKLKLNLNGYLIPRFMYPKDELNSYRIIDINLSKIRAMYKANTVLQYNSLSDKGFVTHLKKSQLFYAGLGLLTRSIRLIFSSRRLARQYKKLLTKEN